ncbi:MAG TPA: outer membrane lipoprotein carrier protein LolA [Terriglobia bacterium]|nr:outer membrane lipoprotein carrier protein LolA [Terriglobia bacterium]
MSRLLLVLFFLLPAPPQGQDLAPHVIVERVSDVYGRLNSLSADFEQITVNRSNRTEHSRGHLYVKTGRRARFDYSSPVQKFEYFDGSRHWEYKPGENQAISTPMGRAEDERLLAFLVLGNRESPWKDQFKEFGLGGKGTLNAANKVVTLTPNNKQNFKELIVEVDPRTFLIHRFAFTRADGARGEYIFRDIKTAPLEDSVFKFTAPPNVNVFVK